MTSCLCMPHASSRPASLRVILPHPSPRSPGHPSHGDIWREAITDNLDFGPVLPPDCTPMAEYQCGDNSQRGAQRSHSVVYHVDPRGFTREGLGPVERFESGRLVVVCPGARGAVSPLPQAA